MSTRVLYVVAHPDDEMQCSGTAALQAAAGIDVTIAVTCNGNLGGLPEIGKDERARLRQREMQAACDVLGANLAWLDFGDDDFMDYVHARYGATEMSFRNLIRRVNPDLLIVPALNDYHQHHRAAAELALNASNNAANPAIVSAEPPSSGLPLALHMAPLPPGPFAPDIYVDITPVFDRKLAALRCHESQHQYLQDHHRTDIFAQIEAAAILHGVACGVRYAEAFSLCRQFNRPAPIQELARFFPPA
jgi:LmbE family N-acetylglucosaminyl deacetylase